PGPGGVRNSEIFHAKQAPAVYVIGKPIRSGTTGNPAKADRLYQPPPAPSPGVAGGTRTTTPSLSRNPNRGPMMQRQVLKYGEIVLSGLLWLSSAFAAELPQGKDSAAPDRSAVVQKAITDQLDRLEALYLHLHTHP